MGRFNFKTVSIILAAFLFIFAQKTFAMEQILNVIIPESGFYDISDKYWATTEITELHKQGILNGYPNNKFMPDAKITRAEFATLAVKALGVSDSVVLEPLGFDDIFPDDWAYDNVQIAYYFGLLTPPRANKFGYYFFNPNDPILRGHAITIAVNALGTQAISKKKAKSVLEYKYEDYYKVPDWFLISVAKAEILDMLAIDPRYNERLIACDRPITRAEAAVLIYNMLEEAMVNPNGKLKSAMTKKKKAEGHILHDAYVEDMIATIPKGTVLPLVVTGKLTSQKSIQGEKYEALTPTDFVTINKYLLLPNSTKFTGHVSTVKRGHYLIRNGVLELENDSMEIARQPAMNVEARVKVSTKKSNSRFRKIFKGEKLKLDRGQFAQMELLQDIKVDLSTGKLIRTPDL